MAGPRRSAFAEAVSSGDLRAALTAVRDQIVADLEWCEQPQAKAALYLRLTDVLGQLSKFSAVKGDTVDEITQRRAARRAGPAAGSSRPKRSG